MTPSDTVSAVRVADAPDAAVRAVALGISRQSPTPLLVTPGAVDPSVAARAALSRHLDGDAMTSGWAALDPSGHAVAVLGATFEVTDEDRPSYTYMPERYATVPLSTWHVAGLAELDLLPVLLERVGRDAAALGIARLLVQTRPHDWLGGSAWRSLGLRPDNILAARRVAPALAPGRSDVEIRAARTGDEDALVALSFEEYTFHTEHTATGTRSDQAEGPTRAIVSQWLAQTSPPGALVAVDPTSGTLLGCLALHVIDLPAGSPGLVYYPRRYGYVGMTSVTTSARGRGIGRALTSRALTELAALGLEHVMLHYIDDNTLSRPFWSRMGFSPHVVTLAGDVLLG